MSQRRTDAPSRQRDPWTRPCPRRCTAAEAGELLDIVTAAALAGDAYAAHILPAVVDHAIGRGAL